MKSHQRIIRENEALKTSPFLFGDDWKLCDLSLKNSVVRKINYNTAKPIIEQYEWIGTMPLPKSCRYIYGIYFSNLLGGVAVFVEPSTRQFFAKYPRKVVQLNRGACEHWTPKNTASYLIAAASKEMNKLGIVAVIAYCTREAGEYGTIYQALNWKYVGETAPSWTYWLDEHWISARTLADKTKWAKQTGLTKWIEKFANLEKKRLAGKFKYVGLIGDKKANREFFKHYEYEEFDYPSRPSSEVNTMPNIEGGSIPQGRSKQEFVYD